MKYESDPSPNTLSELSAEDAEAVIANRKRNTRMLHSKAAESSDPLLKDAAYMDLLARAHGLNPDYDEYLDPDEDMY